MNMIIGKRQIILASLVLALGIAVYLNWQFSSSGEDLSVTGELEEGKNYGDAQYVDKQFLPDDTVSADVYFAQARLTRTKSRDEAIETLTSMLKEADLTEEKKAELAVQATEVAKSIEIEGNIENLIKAKGFEDCMVYLDGDQVNAVVKTAGLLDNEAMQIKDIILSQITVPVENIKILEV